MRTVIDVPDDQIEALRRIGEQAHVSRAEVIRRAITEYVSRHAADDGDEAFGLWRARDEDALDLEDELRSEWSR